MTRTLPTSGYFTQPPQRIANRRCQATRMRTLINWIRRSRFTRATSSTVESCRESRSLLSNFCPWHTIALHDSGTRRRCLGRVARSGPTLDRARRRRSPSGYAAKTSRKEIHGNLTRCRESSSLAADQPAVGARLHILPKGFVKSRCFGGYSCRKRESYFRRCRDLLGFEQLASDLAESSGDEPAEERQSTIACPRCQATMECISDVASGLG